MIKPGLPNQHVQQTAVKLLREHRFRLLTTNAAQVLHARWALRKATKVGSVRLNGKARVVNRGTMTFGDRVRLEGETVRLEFVAWEGSNLSIGESTFINYGTNISTFASVKIGRDCNIGQYCIIMDSDYHSVEDHHQPDTPMPVVIEDDVWLGARTVVLRGSKIGRGSVIGANSVVTGEIPPFSVAAGSPARVVRRLREDADASS